jgi:hypothetical protein
MEATTTVPFLDVLSVKVLDMELAARKWFNGVIVSRIRLETVRDLRG